MIKFKNINGDVFLAVGSIKRKSALNGEKSLTGTLFEGDDVLNKIDKGWSLEFDNEPYVVTYFERNDNDNTVEFDAIHKFFWDMTKDVLYFSWSGSHTVKAYLDQIFNGTGYTYALNFEPSAFEKENWGMKNKLSLFNDVIDSMGGEFEINGTLVSIFKNIGSDLSTIVRHGFNLSDMSLENDNTDFVTYGEGFGAYADQENQTGERLHVTYTSPLAKTFGKLHAEPIDDQRYTIKDNLLQVIKDKVDGSFAISIKLSLYDLTAAGYHYKMANVGDWLLAIDENLDFKQKIRIISVDDEFATDGTRISYTVTCGDVGVVQKYQQANASIGQKVDSAYQNAQDAKESSIQAVIAANGKNTNYYVNGIDNLPATANEGDIAFVQTGDGQAMYIWTKMPDGSFKWVKRLDPDTGEQIAAGVDDAIKQAKSQAAQMDEVRASEAAVFQSEANAALSSAAAERTVFSSNATSMANSAASRASSLANSAAAYGKAQAASALSSANSALTTAKSDLTDDISVAKSEAIAAAKDADGLIHKELTETEDSLTQTISQNKSEADGKISTAQTTATQALNGLSAKVSQTDYDQKTGALDKAVGSAALTADSAALSIKTYQSTADGKLNSQAAAIDANSKAITTKVSQLDYDKKTKDLGTKYGQVKTTADAVTADVASYKSTNDKKVSANTASIETLNNQITSKVSQTDFDKTTGELSGKYTETKQTVDKISNTVTELQAKANAQGQVNQLFNTEFSPDMQGWSSVDVKDITNTNVDTHVYRSLIWRGSRSIGIDTSGETDNYYALFGQKLSVRSGETMSFSWYSKTWRNDNYANLHFVTLDNDNNLINDQYVPWDSTIGGGWKYHTKENIKLEDNASYLIVSFQARQGFVGNFVKPMLVYATSVGEYVAGNYNNNSRVSALELDINGIHGTVDDPNKGLSATWNLANNGQSIAVQAKTAASTADGKAVAAQKDATTAITTANGTQTTVTNVQKDVKDLQSITTQTAGQVTTEIEDRKNGDKSVRTDMADLIDQRITDTKKGYESAISQSANAIMASVSMPNKLFNTEFTPDLDGWETGADSGSQKPYRSFTYEGSNVVGFYTDMTNDKKYAWLRQVVMLPKTISDTQRLSICWDVMTKLNSNYTSLWFKWRDGSGNNLNQDTLFYWNADKADGNWQHKKIENIVIPSGAVSVEIAFTAREQTIQYLAKPMLVFGPTVGDTYMPGSYSGMNTSTVLELFQDNWALGIADNAGRLISGINGDTSGTVIQGKKLVINSDTTINGKAFIDGSVIKNASIGQAQIGKAAIGSAQIINVDVSKISGNIANFITANIDTLNARVMYGDTGHLGTTDTGRVINKQDNHLQLASKGFYDSRNDRAQLELLNNDSHISAEMRGSLNYYGNPTDKGHGLGIRMKYNQILAIDEDLGSKNLYLSPYAGGQVRIVSRDLNSYYDIAAANFRVSSQRKFKSDIKPLEDGALDIVNKTNIKSYVKNGVSEIGVIADEAPDEVLSDDGKFINIYDYTSVLYKAVQELSAQVKELQSERPNN